MTYENIILKLKEGYIAKLPYYEGYFKWDFGKNIPYMYNKDYKKYNLDEEKIRNDWYYII